MAVISTLNTSAAWSPDVVRVPAAEALPTALINTITTNAGAVEGDDVAVRVPVALDAEAVVVVEGTEIPETAPELSEAVVMTEKVGLLSRVSREQFGQHSTADLLARSAAASIVAKADAEFLTRPAPTAGSNGPCGLLNQNLVKGGTLKGNLDVLVSTIATLQTNGAKPTHLVIAPDAWATLRSYKTATDSAMPLLGDGAYAADPVLLGIPVIVNAAMPAKTMLVVDASDIVSACGDVQVAQSSDYFFSSDSIALRSTWRFGAHVVHANRHAVLTVEPAPVAAG